MKYFIILFLVFYFTFSFSQKTNPSLAKKLNDSARYHYDHSDFEKAQKYALLAKSHAESLNLTEELAKAYLMLGSIKMREGHLHEAQHLFTRSLNLAEQCNQSNMQAKSLSNMASALSQLGQYDSAELLIQQIFKLKNIDQSILISGYARLGVNSKRQQQYEKAIGFYLKSLAIAQEAKDSLSSARTLANIGNIYYEQKDASRALQYYLSALALLDSTKHSLSISGISVFASDAYSMLGKLAQAEKFLKRSLRLIKKLHLPASEAYALESIGILKSKQGKLNEAISFMNQALALQRNLDSWESLESILLHLVELYINSGQYEKAKVTLKEGKSWAEHHHKDKDAVYLKEVYLVMSKLDSAQRDFQSSLAHYKQSVFYKDTLFTVEKAKAIEEINRKFETQQKEKTIAEQKLIIETQQAKQLFFVIISVVIIVSGVVIYFFISHRQNSKHQMELEQQRKQRLFAIVIAQERTQQKIARDLHDGLVQVLGAAKISLESTKAFSDSTNYFDKVQEAATIIDKACVDARNISHQLLPYSLQKYGLVMALQELFEKIPKKGAEVYEFKHAGIVIRFKDTIEINVYRIVQELINNIIKHASASKVLIQLSQQTDKLILWISDDGKGFDSRNTPSGAGLMNIESRLQVIIGTMRIESKIGEGTTTIINIPLV